MARFYPGGSGGGGTGSDECTLVRANVPNTLKAVTADSNDEAMLGTLDVSGVNTGTGNVLSGQGYLAWNPDTGRFERRSGAMANRGAVTSALNCGGSYTVPAGYHNGSGKITANSLASQTGGATATDAYVRSGYTYWKDGVKRTGTMSVSSVVSFSVAPYSTSQVIASWKNPSRGPYSGFAICAKIGSYPTSIHDSRVYTGVGNTSALNATNSVTIGNLSAGQTYYFRIWTYVTCSAGDVYSGYLQTTCTPTAHGRVAYTSSGTFTVPTGVRSINIHCTGGGSGGKPGAHGGLNRGNAGGGGGGGCTAYKNGISVSPGNLIQFTVGPGVIWNALNGISDGRSSAYLGSTLLVQADGSYGGRRWAQTGTQFYGSDGASDGGDGANGGYNGLWGGYPSPGNSDGGGYQQSTTTREFGTGTLYSGGGGGGGVDVYHSGAETTIRQPGQAGGAGGGGAGGSAGGGGANGTAGLGGGGGGGSYAGTSSSAKSGGAGGSGNVIITW